MLQTKSQFFSLFHNNLVGMILTGPGDAIVDINEKLLRTTGLHRADVIGKTGKDLGLLDEHFVQETLAEFRRDNIITEKEFSFVNRSGQTIHALISTEPIELDGENYRLTTLVDISKRKQAEDTIKASEIRFRTLASHAPVGIFETDAEGRTTFVNETWTRFTGISFNDALGEDFLKKIHPDDRDEQIRNWNEKVQKREASFSEFRIVNTAGETRWISGNAIPLLDDVGNLMGFIGTITDVTEIRNAMQMLAKSEDDLRKAQRIARIGNWEFNLATGKLFWSAELYRIYELEGCPAEKLFEAYLKKIHPDDLPDLDKAIQQAIENKKGYTIEHRIVCNKGEIKYVHCIAEVLLNEGGEVTGLKGTSQDVTEARKNELLTRESLRNLDTLINTVDGIVWETDVKTNRFVYVSNKAAAILGYPVDNWTSDDNFWTKKLHPEDRDGAIEFDKEHTRLKKNYEFEYRMIAADGSIVWFRDLVTIVVENDEPVQCRGIMIDITEKKMSEQVLQERTRQLSELSAHLQNIREDERTRIAREIHDELGQQLTGLKMDISWLMKRADRNQTAVMEKFNDALQLIDATVNSIRRISAELRPGIIDDLGFNAALTWLVEEFSKRLNINISYSNNFNDQNIKPNISIGLFRILQESLTNIVKHACASEVDIEIWESDHVIQLTVADDGVGFDSKGNNCPEKFGLVGIKERTLMLRGQCDIFSAPGKGTKITVRIPQNA